MFFLSKITIFKESASADTSAFFKKLIWKIQGPTNQILAKNALKSMQKVTPTSGIYQNHEKLLPGPSPEAPFRPSGASGLHFGALPGPKNPLKSYEEN